jgi:hypothetical protein
MLQFRVRAFGGDTVLATLRGRLVLGPETDSFRCLAGALLSVRIPGHVNNRSGEWHDLPAVEGTGGHAALGIA